MLSGKKEGLIGARKAKSQIVAKKTERYRTLLPSRLG